MKDDVEGREKVVGEDLGVLRVVYEYGGEEVVCVNEDDVYEIVEEGEGKELFEGEVSVGEEGGGDEYGARGVGEGGEGGEEEVSKDEFFLYGGGE